MPKSKLLKTAFFFVLFLLLSTLTRINSIYKIGKLRRIETNKTVNKYRTIKVNIINAKHFFLFLFECIRIELQQVKTNRKKKNFFSLANN